MSRFAKVALTLVLVALVAVPPSAHAQFAVYDAKADVEAFLRRMELIKQLAELRATYKTVSTHLYQYQQELAQIHTMWRYRGSYARSWLLAATAERDPNTNGFIRRLNDGLEREMAKAHADAVRRRLRMRGQAPRGDFEQYKVNSAQVELFDVTGIDAMRTLGTWRNELAQRDAQLAQLERDMIDDKMSEKALLQKMSMAQMMLAHQQRDTQRLLASMLQLQLISAQEARDQRAQAMNAQYTKVTEFRRTMAAFSSPEVPYGW